MPRWQVPDAIAPVADRGNNSMTAKPWRIDCIVGARPNFVKIAPVLRALHKIGRTAVRVIHTGQHYDVAMNEVFFQELDIPDPDINLDIGSGTNTEQTARIMLALEPVFLNNKPDMLVVVGDVNSTVAAALVASKLLIPLTHVEAGLRSNDRTMPEEINRLVTDRLSDLLLTTEKEAQAILRAEGVRGDQIHFVGNVMIDTLHACLPRAVDPFETFTAHGASPAWLEAARHNYGFVTLHRPSNVDEPAQLSALLHVLCEMSLKLPLIFAMHPRTRTRIAAVEAQAPLPAHNLLFTPPLSYLQTLGITRGARLVITDSGGLQEETTALGVKCLTVRDNTERPITITEGTNTLVGADPAKLRAATIEALSGPSKAGRIPELWDGRAAERVADHILSYLKSRAESSLAK